jgi:nucleoside-diphosphate-sugar epimerase
MKRVVVFGYGPVGREITVLFAARGDDVLVAQPSAPQQLPAGAPFISCDVTDANSVAAATTGREIAICAVGFRYYASVWELAWRAAMNAMLRVCEQAGASGSSLPTIFRCTLATAPLSETMPLTSYGQKPRIRAAITRLWQDAHAAGRVKAVAVRASDFYGADVLNSILSMGISRLVAGRAALVPFSPDQPHDQIYVLHLARAVVTLCDAPDDGYGQARHVPSAPTHSLRELLTLAARIAEVPLRMRVLPIWLQPILGIAVPELRELIEMQFQTDRPYYGRASRTASAPPFASAAMQRTARPEKLRADCGVVPRPRKLPTILRCTASLARNSEKIRFNVGGRTKLRHEVATESG